MTTAVIGGGVIGLCVAAELRQRGADVVVLDAGRCGAGASRGNAGWVVPYLSAPRVGPRAPGQAVRGTLAGGIGPRIVPRTDGDLGRWLLRCLTRCTPGAHRAGRAAMLGLAADAVRRFEALRERGVRFEQHADGLLCVGLAAAPIDALAEEAERLAALDYEGPFERLTGAQARSREPALGDDVAAGLLLARERHVRPESLVAGLVDHLRAAGASVREHAAVRGLAPASGAGWTLDLDRAETVRADAVVVAAGVASRELLASAGVHVALEGARGTSVTVRDADPPPRHPLKLVEANVACSPFADVVRLSGGYEIGARGPGLPRHAAGRILRAAARYLRWRRGALRAQEPWSGLRPVTPDDLPILGPVPRRPGLFVATGHGTLGVTLAPATGAVLAATVLGERPDTPIDAFRVDRPAVAPRNHTTKETARARVAA